jgi:hypothetical protein
MRVRLLLSFVFVALFVALQGCGGRSYAPVSGTVTLDGKPVANADVTFIPIAEAGTKEAGDTAGGKTNEKGEYKLKTYTPQGWKEGALVGKHRVSISQLGSKGEGDRSVTWEKLPKQYNGEKTELTYEVHSGENKKDWELKSR